MENAKEGNISRFIRETRLRNLENFRRTALGSKSMFRFIRQTPRPRLTETETNDQAPEVKAQVEKKMVQPERFFVDGKAVMEEGKNPPQHKK